jgi:sterol desaturase/sphingolipid hydroxylase (fatty acid hydroxylase superfamily)
MIRRIGPRLHRDKSTKVEDVVVAILIAGLGVVVLLAAALLALPLWSALTAN